jgi:hypothetical protein
MGQWTADAYRKAHGLDQPRPVAKPTGLPRSPVEDFAPVTDAERADLQRRTTPKTPRQAGEDAVKAMRARKVTGPKLGPVAGSMAAKRQALPVEEPPQYKAPKPLVRDSTGWKAGLATAAVPAALEAARRAKGALGDKTGGEGSFDANVRSGAAAATGIGRAPSKLSQAASATGRFMKDAYGSTPAEPSVASISKAAALGGAGARAALGKLSVKQ